MSDYSRREQRAWYVYDWANSAFASTVLTLFLGPYLTSIAKNAADAAGNVYPLGITVDARSLWGYLVGISVMMQVLVLPIAGAVADYGRRKRQMLGMFAWIGASATMCMFFVQGTAYLWGGVLFLIANVAFGAAQVVYNSFLPEIASPGERDNISSRGWGIGYLGGGTLLLLNLVLYGRAESFGISEGMAVRISLWSAGFWWALFTIPPVLMLRNRGPARRLETGRSSTGAALLQLRHTIADLRRYPQTMLFLGAYLLYNDAVQAVIALAAQFGNDELKIPVGTLTAAILMVQFVAFFGAIGFNWIASRLTAKVAVQIALVIWAGVLIYIYVSVKTTAEFFVLAAIVGIVMGGTQALSRSLFSLMIPKGREAEYFSLYEVSDKGTSWICPIIFGLALQFTKSYRLAVLSLIFFFLAGLLLLSRVNVARGAREAQSVQVQAG